MRQRDVWRFESAKNERKIEQKPCRSNLFQANSKLRRSFGFWASMWEVQAAFGKRNFEKGFYVQPNAQRPVGEWPSAWGKLSVHRYERRYSNGEVLFLLFHRNCSPFPIWLTNITATSLARLCPLHCPGCATRVPIGAFQHRTSAQTAHCIGSLRSTGVFSSGSCQWSTRRYPGDPQLIR